MYNLAILGGGPAGYTAAELASKAGLSVILFEQNALGGTCLNVGCIPTKTLLYSAKLYHNARNATKYGVTADNVTFDYTKMQQRKTKVVRKLVAGIRQRLQTCTIVNAPAQVTARTDNEVTLSANGLRYTAEQLLICTGSSNFLPPIPGLKDNPAVWDSTAALDAKELPASIAIIGGGVIGMEFATLYHELGVDVTVIEAMPAILPNLDADIVQLLLDKYCKAGIRILTGTRVNAIEGNTIITDNDRLDAERILVCVGRRANLQGLEALSDLQLDRAAIRVDDFMRTNLKNVYAAGDVTGKVMLAHVAARQAEVAVGRMLRQLPLQRITYNAIPAVVYTNPEIASVGLNEQQVRDFYCDMEGDERIAALEGGVDSLFEVHTLPMTFSGRFVAENEGETGLCKVITDRRNNTILGVHMIGNPCSEFVSAASFAVRMGYTVHEFRQVIFPHPTVSEIIKEAIL